MAMAQATEKTSANSAIDVEVLSQVNKEEEVAEMVCPQAELVLKENFYDKYPGVKFVPWRVIEDAKNILANIETRFLMLPCTLQLCESQLKTLHHKKATEYKEYADCSELKELEQAFNEVIEELKNKAIELRIDTECHKLDVEAIFSGKYTPFANCTLLANR